MVNARAYEFRREIRTGAKIRKEWKAGVDSIQIGEREITRSCYLLDGALSDFYLCFNKLLFDFMLFYFFI